MRRRNCEAFTLVETIAAVTLIGIMASSVLVVFIRCTSAVRDAERRTQAFEVARENMENLLGSDTLSEQVEFGFSEKYPAIQWTNRVEAFFEPSGKRMWARAVCSAEYQDSGGETKKVELTQWLSELSDKQMQAIVEARKLLQAASEQLGVDLTQPATAPVQNPLTPPKDLSQMTPEEVEQWLKQLTENQR